MSDRKRYPLSWPEGWKRTALRKSAAFGKVIRTYDSATGSTRPAGKGKLSIEDAFDRVEFELQALHVAEASVIISTNIPLNMRGMPHGGRSEPRDPGVAVYWMQKGKKQCMAIDAYTRTADNLAAIAATLEAMRAIERHGGAQILERAFLGFAQLPERTSRSWREVLGFGDSTPSADLIRDRFRSLARSHHPDAGGSHEQFAELERARREALDELERISGQATAAGTNR